jgi:hypothetical protein
MALLPLIGPPKERKNGNRMVPAEIKRKVFNLHVPS